MKYVKNAAGLKLVYFVYVFINFVSFSNYRIRIWVLKWVVDFKNKKEKGTP